MDKDVIHNILIENFPDAEINFLGDNCNFSVEVVSSIFDGLSLVEQHKKVLNTLKNKFASGELHALSISTRTK